MESALIQLQVFYEIAMAIGRSLDLKTMLNTSLSTYLRKLNCSAGMVVKWKVQPDGMVEHHRIFTIPRNVSRNPACIMALGHLPEKTDKTGLDFFLGSLPVNGKSGTRGFYHIMELPDFGLLILIKQDTDFKPFVVNGLRSLNEKLAGACIACEQNQKIEAVNQKMQKEIAERRQVESALLIEKNKLETVTRNMGAGIAIISQDYKMLWTNEVLRKAVGDEEDKHCYTVYNQRDQICPDCCIEKIFKTGQSYATCEQQRIDADGNTIWVKIVATPIKGDNGQINSVLEVVVPITEQKEIEAALRESEEKYRSMMEAMSDPVYICSSDLKIEYMNPAMIRRTGYDATGQPCHKALHSLDEQCKWCIRHKVMKGETASYDAFSRLDDRYYHVTHSPICHMDKSISNLAIFRDVTDLVLMEQKLHYAQKMETIGTLSEGIAHDFNNILGAILGNAELAEDDVPRDNPAYENLEEIRLSCIRAKKAVKQLLSFSRKKHLTMEPVNVVSIVKDALSLLRATLPPSVRFNIDFSKNVDTINADPNQVRQILTNLYTNACQSMQGRDGTLTIGVGNKHVDTDMAALNGDLKPGNYVGLRVADTGHGIEPGNLDRIFDPYYTTREVGQGAGLGLSIVHGIVKNHGGAILVDSKVDEFTSVEVLFPVIKET